MKKWKEYNAVDGQVGGQKSAEPKRERQRPRESAGDPGRVATEERAQTQREW